MRIVRRNFLKILAGTYAALAWEARAQSTNTAIVPVARDAKWLSRHEAFLADARRVDPLVVFVGDSITDGWRLEGKAVWNERFAALPALNFGIDGDRTQHVLWRIQHGEFDRIHPRVLVLMLGTNNTPEDRNSTAEVIAGVTAVVEAFRAKLPQTRILLLAIFPRGQKGEPIRAKLSQVNSALSRLGDEQWIYFRDLNPNFLSADGTLPTDLMPDLLHPNEKGYRVWADALREPLAKLLQ